MLIIVCAIFHKIIFFVILIVMTLKKYIADTLGTSNGYAFPSMSDEQLDLKIEYSKDFLSVISLVDPGLTKVFNTKIFSGVAIYI